MKVAYFGDGPWAHKSLDKLLELEFVTVELICGRHSTSDGQLISQAKKYGIPFAAPADINESSFVAFLRDLGVDLLISMSFDQIFKKEILELPPLGAVNCHAGKLPDYKGRNVLNWALINDEKEFGVTVHFIDEGVDTGDIILQEIIEIKDEDTYSSLLTKAYDACPRVLINSINQIANGTFRRTPQGSGLYGSILCARRVAGDEVIDWCQNSRTLFNFIRAVSYPGPVARTSLRGLPVKISAARFIPEAPSYIGVPGSILSVFGEGALVKTCDSFIEISGIETEARIRVGDRFR